jgi:HlyD family secretion protein
MRWKWLLAGGASVVVLAGAGGYLWYSKARRTPTQPTHKTQVERPILQGQTEVSLLGRIQAKNVVSVAAQIDGTIDSYLVDVGEEVFEGELLAHIKNAALDAAHQTAQVDAGRAQSHIGDLESQIISTRLEASRARSEAVRAKGEYERSEKDYHRQQVLIEAGATPRLAYEKAKKEFEYAKANYEGQDTLAQNAEDRVASLAKEIDSAKSDAAAKVKELDNSETQVASGEVRSPVNGLVVARRGQAGDPVDPTMKDLLQIAVDLSALEVAVDPDPRVLALVKQGQAALVQVAEAASAIQGTVREIKAGRVFVDFTSPSPVIKPGLTAQVRIKVG